MLIDEKLLEKIGGELGDIVHLIKLEWRQRATTESVTTGEVTRSQPVGVPFAAESIEQAVFYQTHRLHGWGKTNAKGLAEVYPTDFMRVDDQYFEPDAVSFVAMAENEKPVVLTHTVEAEKVDAAPGDIRTLYTVTVRATDLDGKPVSTPFSWQANVDVTPDPGIVGG